MLTTREAKSIAAAYKELGRHLKGFSPRPQQRAMIQRCANSLADGDIALIEAPTGTGKSLSYLLPALILAILRDKRLIVSTATASLQDQLALNDLPLVTTILGDLGYGEVLSAVAKGRERHICPSKLYQHTDQDDLFDVGTEDVQALKQIRSAWDGGQWDGLRDTLEHKVRTPIWAKVANTATSCQGEACSEYEGCPYYDTKARMAKARIIVTNHDYLLACMVNIPDGTLSDGENNYYVFDEAHHLQDKCLSVLAKTCDLASDLSEPLTRVIGMLPQGGHRSGLGVELERYRGLRSASETAALSILGDAQQHRFAFGRVPAPLVELLGELTSCMRSLIERLEEAVTAQPKNGKRDTYAQFVAISAGVAKGELRDAIDCVESFCSAEPDRARWMSRFKSEVLVHASPFDASQLARKHVWSNIRSAVLTSATLSTLGNFNSVMRGLGLPDTTRCLSLDSPLDYSRARMVVPKLSVDASMKGHTTMVQAFIKQEAIQSANLGVLVYFTSRVQMNRVYEALSPEEREVVLLQGQMQPSAMIAEHKRRVDAGKKSVLFGLDTLSEGIDLPGDYCTRVFITRLPFPSPEDPVLATHGEVLRERGLEPFALLMLPRAALKFAQVSGRLIRKEGDYGEVYVLDARISQKTYGRQMVKSTPFRNLS